MTGFIDWIRVVANALGLQYVRQWKINLIERDNPRWADLYPVLLALPGNRIVGTSGEMGPRDKRENDTGGFCPTPTHCRHGPPLLPLRLDPDIPEAAHDPALFPS